MTIPLRPPFVLLLLLLAGGCDNIGRVFDRDVDPDEPVSNAVTSPIQVVPIGGDVRSGRPKVRAAYPRDGGWPAAVPIVVEFSESVNERSILPTTATGTDGTVVLRVEGTTTALPCQYDFLAEGRLLVMRPLTALSNEQTPTYEVVLLPGARDCDGLRFSVPDAGEVLASFQVNQDESFTDGRILALWPRDNQKDLARENAVVVVFDRPATIGTIVAANLQVRPEGGTPLSGALTTPLSTVGVADGRVATFRPGTLLAGGVRHELVVTADIKFGQDGELDFRGRTPFARFTTIAPPPPTKVQLGNAAAGFVGKINRGNIATAMLRVTVPSETVAGDVVRARIYGGDKNTTGVGDLAFLERTATTTQAGTHTIDLDFSGALGTIAEPRFDEGNLAFAAQMQRGSATSGFVLEDAADAPRFDVTPPIVQQTGPPGAGQDLWTDLESVAFFGTASERLARVTLTDGVNAQKALIASDDSGRFLAAPLALGRLTASRPYSLELVDRAGNLGAAPATGNLVQRGVVTGVLAGTLVVEAYDSATLQPIAGATVLLDQGAPQVPAVGQRIGTTGGDGRVTFDAIVAPTHTITIVRAGYDLVTMYETAAAFASLPLRPTTGAEATFRGTVAFAPGPGVTAVVGATALASRSPLGVRTTNAAPTTIPPAAIVPNRPQVVTGFSGALEPVANPVFASHGSQLLGADLTTPTPPGAAPAGGAESTLTFTIVPSVGQLSAPITYTEDFSLATGLDLASLVGGRPRVRMTASLSGFEGQALLGLGFATGTGGVFGVQSSYSVPLFGAFAVFEPNLWSVAEAEDGAGRISRRRLLVLVGTPFNLPSQVAPIPTITAPVGPGTAAPAVTFEDVFDGAAANTLACVDVTATDGAGRRWLLLASDRDGVGATDVVQFPDLATNQVAGLAAGNWTMVVEARVWLTLSGAGNDDFVLTERVRRETSYSRSAPVVFPVP